MLQSLKEIIFDNISNLPTTIALARVDQRKKHKGSDLGLVWAFVRPLLYICVFYFAISMGFRNAKDMTGLYSPYFIWMSTGIIAWFYISAMIGDGPGCIKKYRYLVNKTVYPVSTIPAIPTFSNLIIHLVMMGFLCVLSFCFKTPPSIYWLQIPIYLFLMVMLGFIWATAAGLLAALSLDFHDMIKAIQPAFFWLSGILFDCRNTFDAAWVDWFFKLNPITYLVQGYRNSFCFHIWIWQEPEKLFWFLVDTMILLLVALWLYKKLRKTLPDIL